MKKEVKSMYTMKIVTVMFLDLLCTALAFYFSINARYDFVHSEIPVDLIDNFLLYLGIILSLQIVVYYIFHLYHSIWRYAGVSEGINIVKSYIILAFIYVIVGHYFSIPISIIFISYSFSFILCVFLRFGYRFVRRVKYEHSKRRDVYRDYENILIIGAGQSTREILKDMQLGKHKQYKVVGLIDDNPLKEGRYLEGIKILGGRDKIMEAVEKYNVDRIIFSITLIDPKDKKEILNICKDTKCKLQMVPGLYELYSGEVTVSKLKDVDVLDLLGRKEIRVNNDEIFHFLTGKTIMVTGAGGSIGSELCRQIARCNPKCLILFDIYENTLYNIQMELNRHYTNLNLVTLVGSIDDEKRVRDVLTTYNVDVIYNAAAHKHVPLMEDSPNEAIKNNVIGTYILAKVATETGVQRFLQISTDKAVNPTNIMGASKRLCEMIVQMMARKSDVTIFSAVRFGNVLGSNGSVIPLFKKQIEEGGPVTVTHKDIIRYFMTIPEAVSLVLQSSYYARGGEIFVLDMGEPVKIDDMARNLIKLSGYEPDKEIKIIYTGLRPGEKLYEELLMNEEGMKTTANEQIFIGEPIVMNDLEFMEQLQLLDEVSHNNVSNILEVVANIVPTYHPQLNKRQY